MNRPRRSIRKPKEIYVPDDSKMEDDSEVDTDFDVDNNGFITLSENKLYRITYKARVQNQGNRNEYVLIFVTTEKNNTLSSSLIIYETEQLIDEARGGGTGSFLYDTTKLPLNERKIRPGISLQYTTAVGNKFNVKSTEGQSVFTINEVK